MLEQLRAIISKLLSGDLGCLSSDNIILVSKASMYLLEKENIDDYDIMCMDSIIGMSQIVYNNTDRSILFLDDGLYDLLLEKYKKYKKDFQVGAPVVKFNQDGEAINDNLYHEPIIFLEDAESFKENSLYYNDIIAHPDLNSALFPVITDRNSGRVISKRNVNVPHMYPKLVGSLDKCKFTLDKEAIDRDVFDNDNVAIFERDFLAKHLQMSLIDMNTPFELIAELKYDGVSVEADVTDIIHSARSRGDANADIAADLTDIFGGYKFPFAPKMNDDEAFGMKFEAIMTYQNLEKMSRLRGKSYKNSRNGIIGLLGSSDAYDYRDLITLVPLATSIEDIDRVTEINFLNTYYNSGVYLNYSILSGTYTQILYQVYRFVQEAETLRSIMPFMYDGVVISYRDPKIIKALGRENSINKYSIAIKFNPLVREAIFTGYTYTVGQNGMITPMIHYTPVEFNGTIHTKSSGHSYKRFNDLNLALNDIVKIEYTNDVIPYVTKPQVNSNFDNPNQPEVFPSQCPFCGANIVITDSGKSAFCPNIQCPERNINRMANMMSKLNVKDFGVETFRFLKAQSLSQLFSYNYDNLKDLGPNIAQKLLDKIEDIKNSAIYDYNIIGSIGFTSVAVETWRKILNVVTLDDIITNSDDELFNKLISIKGIGETTAQIITTERYTFIEDLKVIRSLPNLINSYGFKAAKTIRYSGCRPDDNLTAYLSSMGYDARPDAGVTKTTDILIIPYQGFSSSKVNKVGESTIIVTYDEFVNNINAYIL